MDIERRLELIRNNLGAGAYWIAASETVKFIEFAFRELLKQGLARLSGPDRIRLVEAIAAKMKHRGGQKDVDEFGLGETIGIIRESDFFEAWSRVTGKDLSFVKMMELNQLNAIRIRLAHSKAGSTETGHYEARTLLDWLEGILETFGILSLESACLKIRSAEGTNTLVSGSAKGGHRFRHAMGSPARSSAYSLGDPHELDRLGIQARLCRDVDVRAFKDAITLLDSREGLVALDVGCADGQVTLDRFDQFSVFQQVIGLDIDADAIERAQGLAAKSKRYRFYKLDAEAPDFEESLRSVLGENGLDSVDFIFSAFTLHHLARPEKVLRTLRQFLRSGGVIVVRGSDDLAKIAWPDERDLVRQIIERDLGNRDVSDRLNGRKLYNQLWRAGFRKIHLLYDVIDTVGMSVDERADLFTASFLFRLNRRKRALNADPQNPEVRAAYEWMRDALEEIEGEFLSEPFFFMVMFFVAIGKKE